MNRHQQGDATLGTLAGGLTPFFIDRGAHPQVPLSPPRDGLAAGESPAHYAQRMRAIEVMIWELLAAAQAERKTKLDAGRVDTLFKVGDRARVRRTGRGARGGVAAQPSAGARCHALPGAVLGHTSADDEWLRAKELTHCQEKVADYNATAPRPVVERPAGPILRRSLLP
jgi:hypothetical protein